MKITTGPSIIKFATIRGIDPKEVTQWVSSYVNRPEMCQFEAEKTEAERFDSIKAYITFRINDSIQGRIEKRNRECQQKTPK